MHLIQCVLGFARDIIQLRGELEAKGYFNASFTYYTLKILSNFAVLAVSMMLLMVHGQFNMPLMVLSAILLGLFWQQCGWLAHDFLHHQVFKDRLWNDVMGFALGNLSQGFSVGWWKNKHNAYVESCFSFHLHVQRSFF